MGIEPTLFAWEAEVLPLNYTREAPHSNRYRLINPAPSDQTANPHESPPSARSCPTEHSASHDATACATRAAAAGHTQRPKRKRKKPMQKASLSCSHLPETACLRPIGQEESAPSLGKDSYPVAPNRAALRPTRPRFCCSSKLRTTSSELFSSSAKHNADRMSSSARW